MPDDRSRNTPPSDLHGEFATVGVNPAALPVAAAAVGALAMHRVRLPAAAGQVP